MCGCEPDVPSEVLPTYEFNDPEVTNPLPDTEPFLIPLCVTRAQFQAILDSLVYARGLLSENGCYNEYTAVDLLLGHLPFANKPLEIPCMDACDIITECIETNPGTQTAINNFVTEIMLNSPGFMERLIERVREVPNIGNPLESGIYSGNLLPDEVSDECQMDELYGAALGIVDYFNAAIVDVFEKYEQASNTIEAAAIAAGLAPGVGSTAENAIEIADQIQENLAEAYSGEYDITFRDALACDIFCAAQADGCRITLETINGVLLTRLSSLDFTDLETLIVYVTTGTFTGDQIPEAAFLLVVNALRYGSQFAGILGLSPVAAIAQRAAEQDPSNAWTTLCLACSAYCRTYDLTSSAFDFVPGGGFGSSTQYSSGVGFEPIGGSGQFTDVMRDVSPDGQAPGNIEVTFAAATPAAGTGAVYLFLDASLVSSDIFAVPMGVTGFTRPIAYAGVFDRVQVQMTYGATQTPGTIMTDLKFSGDGVAPSWLSDAADCL